MRAPLLVAWAGGPRARRMSGAKGARHNSPRRGELEFSLRSRVDVESQLEGVYLHDWQRDPYACGAYAWVKVGGGGARKALAAPLRNTLFFAGEAADFEGEAGTVAGALQSGVRAAREILKLTAKTPRPRRKSRSSISRR